MIIRAHPRRAIEAAPYFPRELEVLWILFSVALLVALIVSGSSRVRVVLAVLLVTTLVIGAALRLRSERVHAVDATTATPPTGQISPSMPVSTDSVHAENLQLAGSGAPWELTGTIINDLPQQALRSITLRITRSDCYSAALDPSGCTVLWQGDHQLELRVPAHDRRAFSSAVWPHAAVARTRGRLQDDFKVVAATADRLSQPHP